MSDFLKFFEEKVESYPMHMEIYYSKTTDWCITIWKKMDEKVEIVNVQSNDMELVFAKAHVVLKEWLLENEGGY
ncbi:hypothetical protein GH811_18275 [Acetobacterium malicum]|uniref:Uncharacterized protein n=1 Tax=Acetobacterium malicum TaxID=52692 RepID=A0ABR6Z2B6_9FIRM|nr:hypothetical protein [Acetobacterium malicum]MBC3901549.1 hypothetical protein [Acetobacterium malicum]